MEFNLRRFIFFITGLLFLSCNNDDDIDPLKTSDLSISIEAGSATPAVGTRLVFTLTATNNGPLDATEVVVKNKIPSGYTFDSFDATSGDYDNTTGIWTIGELKNQETVTLNIVVIVNPTGDYKNTASISGGQADLAKTNSKTNIVFTPITVTDDMLYTYTISEGNDKFVTITGVSEVWDDLSGAYKKDITVPGKIKGYPVKVIAESAFYQQKDIVNLILPNTVIKIELSAFAYCPDLMNVTVSDGLLSIGNRAFFNCEKLEEVILPNSILSIDSQVFYGCSSLAKINLPNQLTVIANDMFGRCSSLTDIIIPDSVVKIDSGAFSNCTSLKSIIIPKNVNEILVTAFTDCSALNSLSVAESNQFFSADEKVLYDKNKKKLIYCLKTKSGSFTIPGTVTEIGEFAFKDCVNLTNINISNSVAFIGWYSFSACLLLTQITIPDNVKKLDGSPFAGNINLKTVIVDAIVPPSAQSFFSPFKSCINLTAIKVPSGSVEAYKNAAGWSEYKNIISAQ